MQRSPIGSLAVGLGVGALALVGPILVAGSAHATDDAKNTCGSARVEWSIDGGKKWSSAGLLGALATKVSVRVVGEVPKSCSYKVSLAAYSADGPTWKTSGTQRYLGSKTVTLDRDHKSAALDISKHAPPCFGQIDLYGNDKVFDGKANPLPHYPDAKYPLDLIAGWNGGKACAPPTTKPPTTAPPTTTPPTTAPPTTAPPTTTKPPTTKPPTTSAPPTTATSTPESTPTDEQRPPSTAADVPGRLAQTGASSGIGRIAGASAAILVAGVGALLLVRRRPGNSR
ncbi:hypothetical protein [Embleya scabrispora]|uniref:hypothetical protein n=1 Tax=Embleya scabrispora TaxID=159449 RepID=UPI0003A5E306|nr:hypothetical protein [Embleya scabrispora]MYS87387.1 hypothetical protein [Streptomyces sp. SID5474]